MNLIDTLNHPNRPFTSGEDQHHYRQNSSGITADKARPCHCSGTKVTGPTLERRAEPAESVTLRGSLILILNLYA